MNDLSNGAIAALAILTFVVVTLPTAAVVVLITRGRYYKELPARVDQLEQKDQKSYEEIQRLRKENSNLWSENKSIKEMVTGHRELEEIIRVLSAHDREAAGRHQAVLEALNDIFTAIRNRT